MTMCEHTNTKPWRWMGRDETVCLDCWEVGWHEDKPMTWSHKEEVFVVWDGADSFGKFWDKEDGGESG